MRQQWGIIASGGCGGGGGLALGLRGGGMGSPKAEKGGQMDEDADLQMGGGSAIDPLGLELEEVRLRGRREEARRAKALEELDEAAAAEGEEAWDEEMGGRREIQTVDDMLKFDAEADLKSLPTAMGDWRHTIGPDSSSRSTIRIRSKFRDEHPLAQRKAMASKIVAAGKGVPVICERLHDGIALPATSKPRFMVPGTLSITQFAAVLAKRLPWSDSGMKSASRIRLFLNSGTELASGPSMGELHATRADEDGFLYMTYADTLRPDLGSRASGLSQQGLTGEELDKLLENRAQVDQEEELEAPDDNFRLSQFLFPQLKAITLQQPLADAVLLGLKKVEGRNHPLKMPKKGGMWMALHVGRSLDHFTNYQVMQGARQLWPACPLIPTNRKRMGCIVGMMHIKECIAAHLCRDPWRNVPNSYPYYLVIDKILPIPEAIHHRHSFQMWTINETVAQDIVAFMGERKGRLFEYPTLPKADVLTEGYQVKAVAGGRPGRRPKAAIEGQEAPGGDEVVLAGIDAAREDWPSEGWQVPGDQGMDDEALLEEMAGDEEDQIVTHQLHPLEQMMLCGTARRKYKMLHPDVVPSNLTEAEQAEAKLLEDKEDRIFFMKDIGPHTALKYYREWAKETAMTIREKLFGGYKISSAEWKRQQKQQASLPVVWIKKGNSSRHIVDDFWDYSLSAEQDKVRWDELDAEDEEDAKGWSISEESSHEYNETHPAPVITPAYMKEAIIDHLGILPPEMVKKSVLDALTPLTFEESRIKMRDKNGTTIFYDPALDDGTYRMRPGTAALHGADVPSSEQEEGALFVPKVGKHKTVLPATAKSVFKEMVGAPDLSKAPSELARRKREKKREGDEDDGRGGVSSSEVAEDDAKPSKKRRRGSAVWGQQRERQEAPPIVGGGRGGRRGGRSARAAREAREAAEVKEQGVKDDDGGREDESY